MAAKINMRLDKNEMPSQDPNVRNKNFLEVALGYTEEQALDEAARCLHCKNHPCVDGCPVNVRIPEFIAKIVERDYEGAYQVIHQTSSLPAVCGRVCPQESQCEMHCVRGKKGDPVGIGRLERFVADWHNSHSTEAPEKPQPNGHKVAVVGSGPAGLTCAGDLAKKGYEVTVFEALHLAGGVLVYGIPEFRLPKSIVQKEVDGLKAMGVKVETNTVVGRTITIDELMEENGFEAVFVGSGAGLPMFMHIPGENLKGVYSANEFLTRINLMKAYRPDSDTPIMDLKGKKVAVVGGGNVAMDAARCSKRLGADVYVVYRRGMEELPARHEEVEHAIEEGVVFKTLNNPVQINGDEQDCVKSMTCIEMELGEPDASGRRRPVEKKGSEFELPVDAVIMSLGTTPNPLIKSTTKGLEVNKKGGIIVNEDGLTSRQGVYAGGDAVTVTTIHRSKGLEYPVVFLAGCNERFRKAEESSDIAMDRELGFACKLRDNYTMLQHKTLPLAAMQLQNRKTRLQEEMRILYVGLTRAREKLYLMATGSKITEGLEELGMIAAESGEYRAAAAVSSWDWLRGTVMQEQGLELRIIRPEELPPPESEELEQAQEAIPVEGEALQRLEEKLRFSYPYPADTVTPRRMAVSELAERAAREHYLLKRRPKCLTRQEATAAERGNAAHRAMQFADLTALKKDPKAEIERLVAEGYLYREDGGLIDTGVLEKLMNSPLGERMRKADRVEREMRFLQEFTPEELAAIDPALRVPGTTLIMGAVDAVLVEGDHAVLLDYKTDRVAAPQELTGRYALQLKLYAAMVRRQFGLPVTEAVLYSFCLGQAVKVEL